MVLWDKIILSSQKEQALLNLTATFNEYALIDQGTGMRFRFNTAISNMIEEIMSH